MIKDNTSKMIEFFMQRQHRLIPGSLEGGFSIFTSLLEVIRRNSSKCKDAINILNDNGVNFNNYSLCNWICRNASTGEFHQDSDSSYSLICVPFNHKHKSTGYIASRGVYCFEFKWNKDSHNSLKISLDPGVGIYFLGGICDHRQHILKSGEFINLACYQNKRLFSSLKNSIIRILE